MTDAERKIIEKIELAARRIATNPNRSSDVQYIFTLFAGELARLIKENEK